ncbi:YdaU family protein [Devosia aurantiaca]|uniref:YdaU family protein n=1 Tax=Devosia aurantiaca TaxID=2714858 RepID=UPI001F3BF80F|nr:DUF1376 domain-containing protein [Devosia aurantiaca]
MPLHIENYLADTGHLTAAEHGAYLMLIMHYWREGSLPDDERIIARISRLTASQWAGSRPILAALFREGWKHKRIDEELSKADDIIEKRRNAALGRHAKSKGAAHAEQMHGTSSDTRVPPRTKNQDLKEEPNGSSKSGAVGSRMISFRTARGRRSMGFRPVCCKPKPPNSAITGQARLAQRASNWTGRRLGATGCAARLSVCRIREAPLHRVHNHALILSKPLPRN